MPRQLFVDVESRGRLPLKGKESVGAFRYAEHVDTSLLGIGLMLDAGPLEIVECWRNTPEQRLSEAARAALQDPDTTIVSWGEFDRVLLAWAGLGAPYGWPRRTAARWLSAMDAARASNLPSGLDLAAAALGLTSTDDVAAKDKRGAALIKRFCMPQKNGQFLDLADHLEEAHIFIQEYLPTDVRLLARLFAMIPPLSPREQAVAEATWQMNVAGVGIDAHLAEALVRYRAWAIQDAKASGQERHGVNVNSPVQVKTALAQYGVELPLDRNGRPTIGREQLRRTLAQTQPSAEVHDLVALREQTSGASLAKAAVALRHRCADGRARGLFGYSATLTGRWTSHAIQLQNLPRPAVPLKPGDVEVLVDLIVSCVDPATTATLLPLLFGGTARDAAISAIRALIVPAPGHCFVVGDFKTIEVVTNWAAAGEADGLAALTARKNEYSAFANTLLARVTQALAETSNNALKVSLADAAAIIRRKPRDIGKVGLLSIQYGTSAWGLARQSNIPLDLAELMIAEYNQRYPRVAIYQTELRDAAIRAVRDGGTWRLPPLDLLFRMRPAAAGSALAYLEMVRPSGEALRYLDPKIETRRRGHVQEITVTHLLYDDAKFTTFRRDLRVSEQAENAASSIARDALADGLVRITDYGFSVVMAIHDELVVEVSRERADSALGELLRLMETAPPWWPPTAPLYAEGAVISKYQKI